jgi:SulP family sulfate permease
MLGYAVFASSRQVIAGPDAAIALLVGSAVGPLAGGDPARTAVLAAAMALIGGTIMLIAAWLRLVMIADFLSKPVLVGYMTGAALILVSTQLGRLFGLKLHERDFFPLARGARRQASDTHVPTFAMGVGLLGAGYPPARRTPGAGRARRVRLGLVAFAAFDLEALGVEAIGNLPSGLPRVVLPIVSRSRPPRSLPGAIGIALLTFPEGILLARAFAAKNRYEVRPEQELLALAAANLAAGFFQGFPVGASQSRTTVNDAAGGRSQLASLVAATALVLFLLLLTPLLRFLPTVALAAILLFAGAQLVGLEEYARLYRDHACRLRQRALVTLGVLIVGVVPGIVIGIMLSLILLLGRLARPADAVLQRVPGTASFHDLGEASATETVPGLIAYRFYAPLVFANADHFMERVRGLVAGSPNPVRWLLVDVQAVTQIDVTAAEMLSRLAAELHAQGIELKFARANRPLREEVARIGLGEHLGESTLFPSVHAAIEAFLRAPQSGAGCRGRKALRREGQWQHETRHWTAAPARQRGEAQAARSTRSVSPSSTSSSSRQQEWIKEKGLKVCIVFEGRDGAGKGGIIKAINERVSPRVYRVVALPAPTEREKRPALSPALRATHAVAGRNRHLGPQLVQPSRRRARDGLLHRERGEALPRPRAGLREDHDRRRDHPHQVLAGGEYGGADAPPRSAHTRRSQDLEALAHGPGILPALVRLLAGA